jgi:putative hydroxymethylpyrimidine transporter CytX
MASTVEVFATIPGDRHSEVPATLLEPVPQPLSLADQVGLWGNLGVSLLGFTGAIFVLQPGGAGTPRLSIVAAVTATVVGTVLGTLAVGLSGLLGARTGAPAMVLLRGLFGARLSYVPTMCNVVQCVGWAIFELVIIATAAHRVAPALPHWCAVLIAGVLTTGLALRPLGMIRLLRKYVTAAVVVVMTYLLVELARHPLPPLARGTWSGFWVAMDTTVAVAVSFVPLASDYTRHSRSGRDAFAGSLVGYSVTQVACYLLGILALLRTPNDIYGAFIAVPVGALAFAVLAARELDQSFADVYSTAVSLQNLRGRWDRRWLAAGIGTFATILALWFKISDYENFLLLLGSIFVPMSGVLVVDFFLLSRGRWDLSESSPARWRMVFSWAVGFVTYQLINPGYISWWESAWSHVRRGIGFTPASWMSASLCSLVVASVATVVVGSVGKPGGKAPGLDR